MNAKQCPQCGGANNGGAAFCSNCGYDIVERLRPDWSRPQQIQQPTILTPLMLDCSACRATGSMTDTKTGRFSPVVRTIGGILLVPSFLGFGFGLLLFLSTMMAAGSTPTARSDAEMAGQAIGIGFMFIVVVIIVIGSLVGGLLGWLLLQNRKVWKCLRCGFILDRA